MAEAASSRRRGVVNVRAIKGLFLILSLLCLVQVSSSLVDSDHLDILQDYFQKGKVNAAIKKKQDLAAYRGATEEELEEIWTFIEVLDALHSEL
ncbi:uncharacterized protein PAE49_021686 isoform 2-T2 [Odontesthes bonariensis]